MTNKQDERNQRGPTYLVVDSGHKDEDKQAEKSDKRDGRSNKYHERSDKQDGRSDKYERSDKKDGK